MRHGEKDYRDLAADMFERAREKLGVSQARYGELLGEWLGRPALHLGQIGKYERGENRLPADYLLALKDMTGLSLDSLLDEVDEMSLRAEVARLSRLVDELLRRDDSASSK